MRLDFNVVFVDDDFLDDQDREDVDNLIQKLKVNVALKGFELKEHCFPTIEAANQYKQPQNRIDLFLSDNNLGNNQNHVDATLSNGGIDYYLHLRKQKYTCDFVLYTMADRDEIVNKLSADLNKTKDPSLFTRFTFINRDETDAWHTKVLNLLDHLLTKREELNNIRGLYAQKVSEIDLHLKSKFPDTKEMRLKKTIRSIPSAVITDVNRKFLDTIREIRNGLMHYEETFCSTEKEYVIRFAGDDKSISYEIYESKLQIYRDKLNQAYQLVMSLP